MNSFTPTDKTSLLAPNDEPIEGFILKFVSNRSNLMVASRNSASALSISSSSPSIGCCCCVEGASSSLRWLSRLVSCMCAVMSRPWSNTSMSASSAESLSLSTPSLLLRLRCESAMALMALMVLDGSRQLDTLLPLRCISAPFCSRY